MVTRLSFAFSLTYKFLLCEKSPSNIRKTGESVVDLVFSIKLENHSVNK